MKKFLLICLFVSSINPVFSQHRVITLNGDTINSEVIDLNRNFLVFYGHIRLINSTKIDLKEVKVLFGTPNFRIKPILKINPEIILIEEKKPKDYIDDFYTAKTPKNYMFSLTPEGFRNNIESDKDYIVIDFPNNTQEELFKRVLLFVNSSFVSPKDVISKVDNELISLNGFAKDAVKGNFIGSFDLNYTISIQFKDGRIRINAPSINKMINISTKVQEMILVGGTDLTGSYFAIFNRKGEVKSQNAKVCLEDYFENLINTLIDTVKINKNDDW